jgi:hypothetical protein
MKQRPDPRRWATGWLSGILAAAGEGRITPNAVRGAAARALRCGVTEDQIAARIGRL